MPFLIRCLYYLAFALLTGLAAFIYGRNPRSPLHRCFALASLALLGWLATLFLYNQQGDPAVLTLMGRLNFVAAAFVALMGYRFVKDLTNAPAPHAHLLLWETLLLSLLTLVTPLIDRAEILQAGQRVTRFGPLFFLLVLHLVGYLAAAIHAAFVSSSASRQLRSQLSLIGTGMLATSAVALTTNVILPYGFHDFAFQDIGALSTLLFLVAVADAILTRRLFDIRLFVRRTLVYGLLLSFVLAVYSALILLVTDRFTREGAGALSKFGVLIIAFSFDPIRRFVESRVDQLLFPATRQRPHATYSSRQGQEKQGRR